VGYVARQGGLDSFGAECAGSQRHFTALHEVLTTSPFRKSDATKAMGLREPLSLAIVSLGGSSTLASIDIDKVGSWRGMTTCVVWLW